MKVVLLVAGGRAGSDFFHSLIDDHQEILQLPGYLKIDDNLSNILSKKFPNDISKEFIKSYPVFFDSRINKEERWDKLGIKKNKFFKVDKKKFCEKFKILSKNKTINKFTNLKNFEIIYTTRHPLASLSSAFKAWINYDKGSSFFPKDLHNEIGRIINDSFELNKIGKVSIIKLEKVHLENKKTMKNFCKKFKIKYEKSLTQSTKNGLIWWGDIFSRRYLSGINKNLKIKINEKYFFKRDLIFFSKFIIRFNKELSL